MMVVMIQECLSGLDMASLLLPPPSSIRTGPARLGHLLIVVARPNATSHSARRYAHLPSRRLAAVCGSRVLVNLLVSTKVGLQAANAEVSDERPRVRQRGAAYLYRESTMANLALEGFLAGVGEDVGLQRRRAGKAFR